METRELLNQYRQCWKNKEYDQGVDYLKQAIEKGSIYAMTMLGEHYEKGIGEQSSDIRKAIIYYKMVYDTGCIEAGANLGHLYSILSLHYDNDNDTFWPNRNMYTRNAYYWYIRGLTDDNKDLIGRNLSSIAPCSNSMGILMDQFIDNQCEMRNEKKKMQNEIKELKRENRELREAVEYALGGERYEEAKKEFEECQTDC